MVAKIAGEPRFLGSFEDAKKVLDLYDVIVFDMDGVLWQADKIIDGAREAIAALVAAGKELYFASNNSLSTPLQYVEKLSKLGFGEYPVERICCASNAAAVCLADTGYRGKVLMVGMDALKGELSKIEGITLIDGFEFNDKRVTPSEMAHAEIDTSIGAVVMGFDQNFNYSKFSYAAALLAHNKDAIFIATNPDPQFPTPRWTLPGTGSLVRALETAAGRDAIMAGKPGSVFFKQLISRSKVSPEKMCIVGDNLLTDITFGKKHGIGCILTETGIHTRKDLHREEFASVLPDFVIPSIGVLNKPVP